MLSYSDLRKMARARVADAKVLHAHGRYDGAAYVVGYAVELQLKARIAGQVFGCRGFPEEPKDFDRLTKLKTHKLEDLAAAAARDGKLKGPRWSGDWNFFLQSWRPESRYAKVNTNNETKAGEMIRVVERLLKAL